MADYLGGYASAMDREYFQPLSDSEKNSLMPIKEISISTAPMKNQIDELKAKIFGGASKIELGFWMSGGGGLSQGNNKPDFYGDEARRAIRELADLNKVEFTTHAAPQLGPLSGLDRQGSFSDEARKNTLFEIQKSIDFAADVARGGAVVIHTGEWQRPISSVSDKKAEFTSFDFSEFGGKKEEGFFSFVDDRTGKVQMIPKDLEIHKPVVKERKKTELGEEYELYEKDKNDMIDVKAKSFHDLIAELKQDKRYKYDEKTQKFTIEQEGKEKKISHEEMFMRNYYEDQLRQAKAQSKRLLSEAEEEEDRLKIIKNDPQYSEEDKKRVQNRLEREAASRREMAASHAVQAKQIEDTINHMKPVEEEGMKKTAQGIAQAAMYAYDVQKKKEESGIKFKSDLFVAPENIYPESYGAHPQELKKIIQESRKAMENYLVSHKKMNSESAKKIAESRIKATFDVGHAYTWKKYFKGEEKDFNKWLLDQVDDLNKNNIIGHVHITDNMGYDDDHMLIGEGKVPLQDFVEKMRKKGGVSINVEPGEHDLKGMVAAWKEFGHPITGLAGSRTDRWTNIENSYFGNTRSPYFIFAEYAPSDEYRGSPFWTGLPLD